MPNLSEANKVELKKLNEEIATLSNAFATKLLAGTKEGAFFTTDKAALAASPTPTFRPPPKPPKPAKEGYLIPLQNTTQQPVLVSLSDRATRQAIFENSWNAPKAAATNDTRETIARSSTSAPKEPSCSASPTTAPGSRRPDGQVPRNRLQVHGRPVPLRSPRKAPKAGHPGPDRFAAGSFQLQPWDWDFYSEQVRKAKYDLDEARSNPTSRSTMSSRTASFTPPPSSTASPLRSAMTSLSGTPMSASSRSSTPTANPSPSSTATTSSATTSRAAPG